MTAEAKLGRPRFEEMIALTFVNYRVIAIVKAKSFAAWLAFASPSRAMRRSRYRQELHFPRALRAVNLSYVPHLRLSAGRCMVSLG